MLFVKIIYCCIKLILNNFLLKLKENYIKTLIKYTAIFYCYIAIFRDEDVLDLACFAKFLVPFVGEWV